MIHPFKNKKQTTNASARVVDGKLILSLPEATSPIVWQMDLTQTKASALEVCSSGDGAAHTLTLKTPRGETVEIAHFKNRTHAVEGLMSAASALENAHGQIRTGCANDIAPSVSHQTPRQKKSGKKWLIGILGVLFLLILINIWGANTPRPPSSLEASSAGGAINPAQSSGVPISADDFLRQQ